MSNELIGNVRERWAELGNDDPERVAERYRGDPWRLFYNGWIEGRAELISARAKDAELIQRLVDAGDVMKQWLGLTLQMDGESCPDCGYDWGKGHNYGCAQLQHQKAIDEWDAAKTAGFKPSEQ